MGVENRNIPGLHLVNETGFLCKTMQVHVKTGILEMNGGK